MKIIRQKTNKAGKRELTVVIDDNETLTAVRPDLHYRLGYPVEDIVPGVVLDEAVPVSWCPVEQKWVE